MPSSSRGVALAIASSLVCGLPGCGTSRGRLPAGVDELLRDHPGVRWSIAYRDLERGSEVLIGADVAMHAASTMKLPVMIEAYRRADRGDLDLDAGLVLENDFTSIVDGSHYALDPADDSDPDLYERVGQRVPIRALVRAMIQRSSNLATNALIETLGADAVQRTVDELGADGMRVLRGVEDGKAYAAGISNTTTAHALLVLLEAIQDDTAASTASCREMREILEGQALEPLIARGLPPGTRIANKTGQITAIRHDAAIVRPDGAPPYVLVVMTNGFDDPADSARFIASIARSIHAMHTGG